MSMISPEFCPQCGTPLALREFDGRTRGYCEDCDEHIFHIPAACAGVAVVEKSRVLLIQRATTHSGTWAIPAGFIEWDEEPREAAARELFEEAAVDVSPSDLHLVGTTRHEDTADSISSITLNYAVPRENTAGDPTPGEEARATRFVAVQKLEAGDYEVRSGEKTRIRLAIEKIRDVRAHR
jgi:ADP-ribose pyrophosphatase YjhB (NUDIX family)